MADEQIVQIVATMMTLKTQREFVSQLSQTVVTETKDDDLMVDAGRDGTEVLFRQALK